MLLLFIIGKLKRFFIYFSVLNFLFFKSKLIEIKNKKTILWQKEIFS